MIGLAQLRTAIAAEEKRLETRPVPTEPWIMPLGLTQLRALVDVAEAAQTLVNHPKPMNVPAREYAELRAALASLREQGTDRGQSLETPSVDGVRSGGES